MERLGSTNNLGPIVTYNNPSTVFIFPWEYGVSNTDTSSQVGESTYTNTITYDAYGTLTTSFGTNTNVLRIKTIDGQKTIYNWMALNPLRDLMAVSLYDNQVMYYSIIENTNLNTTNNLAPTNFKLYPNPTSDFISIEKSNYTPESFISVYDLLGNEIIKKHSFSEAIDKINVSNFTAGMYFVSIKNAEDKIIHHTKFIKK